MAKPSILIIDDSALFRDFLANKLKASHLVVIVANNGADGAKKISHHHGLLPQ
jgi:CheY-like chemotaxis protein